MFTLNCPEIDFWTGEVFILIVAQPMEPDKKPIQQT